MHRAAGHVRGESDTLLQCKYARHNGAGIVRASGDIDLPNVHLFAEMLDQALGDSQTVIIDLAEVSYIDSTGLNVLIGLHEQCARRKTNMAVVFTSRNLWRIFSVLSLQDVFRVFPTVDAALRALSHSDGRGGQPLAASRRASPSTAGTKAADAVRLTVGIRTSDASMPSEPARSARGDRPEARSATRRAL